jgi:peptide subunit release factor 1 (eRF1)
VEPLARIGARERWCVLLANRHVARILCGSRDRLEEVERIDAEVGTRELGGSTYPANEMRAADHDLDQHFKRVSRVMLERYARRRLDGLLIGAPRELASELEARLHPEVRHRLHGRVEVDIERSTPEHVLSAAEPVIAAVARRREDDALGLLAQRLGAGDRAAAGLEPVVAAVNAHRVETLVVEDGFAAAGVRCPTCEWLGLTVGGTCPADGTALLEVDDVVEAAVERAIAQDADIQVIGDRPELSGQGGIAAILRY